MAERHPKRWPAALLVLWLASACIYQSSGYPVFGTKRYGRGAAVPRTVTAWNVPPPVMQSFPPHPQAHYGYGLPGPVPYYSNEPVMSYPFPREFADSPDYYYGEPTFASYPYYYPGNNKYPPVFHHHSLMPYYYGSAQQRAPYGPYGFEESSDPVEDLEEEIQQEEEREEREEALPIGQETWFENSANQAHPQQDMADVNAIFLQNLILSQMYNDAMNRGTRPVYQPPESRYSYAYAMQEEDPSETEGWVYGDVRAHADPDYYRSDRDSEDADVRALKSLVKKDASNEMSSAPLQSDNYDTELPLEGGSWVKPDELENNEEYQESDEEYNAGRLLDKKQPEYEEWVPQKDISLNFSDRKGTRFHRVAKNDRTWAATAAPSTAAPPQGATEVPAFDRQKGMKEVALPRPPNPVRHRSLLEPIAPAPAHGQGQGHSQKPLRAQSVYDTIKHLINMQEKLHVKEDERQGRPAGDGPIRTARSAPEQNAAASDERPRQFKRFVSNEEALVEELSGLKKLSA